MKIKNSKRQAAFQKIMDILPEKYDAEITYPAKRNPKITVKKHQKSLTIAIGWSKEHKGKKEHYQLRWPHLEIFQTKAEAETPKEILNLLTEILEKKERLIQWTRSQKSNYPDT